MTLVVTLLILVSLILLGAVTGKPIGWIVIGLSVLALLLVLLGGFNVSVGR
jgi:hypothetical protein